MAAVEALEMRGPTISGRAPCLGGREAWRLWGLCVPLGSRSLLSNQALWSTDYRAGDRSARVRLPSAGLGTFVYMISVHPVPILQEGYAHFAIKETESRERHTQTSSH